VVTIVSFDQLMRSTVCVREDNTYVDNGPVPQLSPGEVVDNMAELEAGALGERPHGVAEPTGALWELGKHLVDGGGGVIRQSKTL
jgi:hypothetical protein